MGGAPHLRIADRRGGHRSARSPRPGRATRCCSPARATRPTRSSAPRSSRSTSATIVRAALGAGSERWTELERPRGARPAARAPVPSRATAGVSTDTRTLAGRRALRGARRGAVRRARLSRRRRAAAGALGAVVRRGHAAGRRAGALRGAPTRCAALGWLARARRRRDRAARSSRVTGTNGKTSTKEMLAAVLAHPLPGARDARQPEQPRRRAAHDPRGAGRHRGAGGRGGGEPAGRDRAVPRDHRADDRRGHQRRRRGTWRGSARWRASLAEKLSLVEGVPLAVVGTEPPALAAGARQLARRVVTAGARAARNSRPESVDARCGGPGDRGHRRQAALHAAAAGPAPGGQRDARVGGGAGSSASIRGRWRGRWSGSTMPGGRGELIQAGGLTILNDCYNANPQSFRAAIATAQAMRGGRRLVFVAGTMRELGAESARAPRRGRAAAGGAEARPAGGGRRVRPGARAVRAASSATGCITAPDAAGARAPLLARAPARATSSWCSRHPAAWRSNVYFRPAHRPRRRPAS